ncbi:unnamed protein product [Cuscuta epithymum]|uniref:Uncharacterized protein n=1 Tax=Cuscuta epithymum TaxID=186058 RepID=A0AAV0DS25_9ASTE|nr:unnamed protein product [Cuscuta epithymum]
MATSPRSLLLVLFLLLINPTPSSSLFLPLFQYETAISLTHTLFNRVADHRAALGDVLGAARVRSIAKIINQARGIGLWKLMWNHGRSFVRNSFNFNLLVRTLGELTRVGSEEDQEKLANRNNGNVIEIANDLSGGMQKAFSESGAFAELMELVRKEVVEGDLLKDCLRVGGSDLKALIQNLKNISLQLTNSSPSNQTDI